MMDRGGRRVLVRWRVWGGMVGGRDGERGTWEGGSVGWIEGKCERMGIEVRR